MLSMIGLIVIAGIKIYGMMARKTYKINRHGYCWYINIGKNWGGITLGMFFLTDRADRDSAKWHKHGHAIQNCIWGPLMLFVITIPSAIRYCYRTIRYTHKHITAPVRYDAIWFEKSASKVGRRYKKYFSTLN